MAEEIGFAALIRAARGRLGLDLEAAAEASGCSESYISLIETGKRLPSEELAVRLACSLGIDSTEALLSLVRARLPEGQRSALDPMALVREPAVQFAVMREVISSQLRACARRIVYRAAIAASGDAEVSLRCEQLRPAAGGAAMKEITLFDPLGTGPLKPRILEAPKGLHFEIEAHAWGDGHAYSLVFPEGWSADDPAARVSNGATPVTTALTFEFCHSRPNAFEMDMQATLTARGAGERTTRNHAARWAFPAFAPILIDTLTVAVVFPDGCQPTDLSVWSWLGNGPLEAAADNLIPRQSCQMHEVVRRDDAVELTVHQPLPLYSYALVWTPPDRTDRLDAARRAGRPAAARIGKRSS